MNDFLFKQELNYYNTMVKLNWITDSKFMQNKIITESRNKMSKNKRFIECLNESIDNYASKIFNN